MGPCLGSPLRIFAAFRSWFLNRRFGRILRSSTRRGCLCGCRYVGSAAQLGIVGHGALDPALQGAIRRGLTVAQRRLPGVSVIADGFQQKPARFRLIHIDFGEDCRQVAFQGPPIVNVVLEDLCEMKIPAVSRGVAASASIHKDWLHARGKQTQRFRGHFNRRRIDGGGGGGGGGGGAGGGGGPRGGAPGAPRPPPPHPPPPPDACCQ